MMGSLCKRPHGYGSLMLQLKCLVNLNVPTQAGLLDPVSKCILGFDLWNLLPHKRTLSFGFPAP